MRISARKSLIKEAIYEIYCMKWGGGGLDPPNLHLGDHGPLGSPCDAYAYRHVNTQRKRLQGVVLNNSPEFRSPKLVLAKRNWYCNSIASHMPIYPRKNLFQKQPISPSFKAKTAALF